MPFIIWSKNARQKIIDVINNGSAYEKFEKMIFAHGGKIKSISLNPSSNKIIKSSEEGYLNIIDTKRIGMAIIELEQEERKLKIPSIHKLSQIFQKTWRYG